MMMFPERKQYQRPRMPRSGKAPPRPFLSSGVHAERLPNPPPAPSRKWSSITAPSNLPSSAITDVPPELPPEIPDAPIHQRQQSPERPLPPIPPLQVPDFLPPPPEVPTIDAESLRQAPANEVLIGGDTVAQLRELRDLREKDISKRVNLKNGVRDIISQRRHAERAHENFMKACASIMTAVSTLGMDTIPEQNIQKAWKQLQQSSGRVNSRDKALGAALDDWFHLENKLSLKEGAVYQKLNGILGGGRPDVEDDFEYIKTEHFTMISARSSSASSTTQSIAHQYYSQVGDINLLRERIFNFDSEHRRQEFIRESQRLAGQALEPPDEIFYQKFYDDKAGMVQKYLSDKQKMEEIRASCDRQGVKVEEPNLPAFLDHSHRIERSVRDQSGPDGGEKEKAQTEVSQRHEHVDQLHRTARWARSVRVNKSILLDEDETWDALSQGLVARTLNWTAQRMEDNLSLPQYENLEIALSLAEDPINNEGERKPQSRSEAVSQGEAPRNKRRYSTPDLPTFSVPVQLHDGILEIPRPSRLFMSSKTCVQEKSPDITYELQELD
jgi:hypothetical protein